MARAYPAYRINALEFGVPEAWLDLDKTLLAWAALLHYPQTATSRVAWTCRRYLTENPPIAKSTMFVHGDTWPYKWLPEAQATSLTDSEKQLLHTVLHNEQRAMLIALDYSRNYEEAYLSIFPYSCAFPAEITWVLDAQNVAQPYHYAELLAALHEGQLPTLLSRYSIDLKLYQEYLRRNTRSAK